MGKEQQYKAMAKHSLVVPMRAGITEHGASKVCFFDQVMDAIVYVA